MDQREPKNHAKQFGLRFIKLAGALPDTSVGREIGNQLIRSALRKSARGPTGSKWSSGKLIYKSLVEALIE